MLESILEPGLFPLCWSERWRVNKPQIKTWILCDLHSPEATGFKILSRRNKQHFLRLGMFKIVQWSHTRDMLWLWAKRGMFRQGEQRTRHTRAFARLAYSRKENNRLNWNARFYSVLHYGSMMVSISNWT